MAQTRRFVRIRLSIGRASCARQIAAALKWQINARRPPQPELRGPLPQSHKPHLLSGRKEVDVARLSERLLQSNLVVPPAIQSEDQTALLLWVVEEPLTEEWFVGRDSARLQRGGRRHHFHDRPGRQSRLGGARKKGEPRVIVDALPVRGRAIGVQSGRERRRTGGHQHPPCRDLHDHNAAASGNGLRPIVCRRRQVLPRLFCEALRQQVLSKLLQSNIERQ